MIYVFLALVCAATFGLCFLIDRQLQRHGRRFDEKHIVRQPRRSVVMGALMLTVGLFLLLYFRQETFFLMGGIVLGLLGAILLLSFFSFSLAYDDEVFVVRTFKGKTTYQYNQIRGEQALATRSGIVLTLFVGDTFVELSEAMQGVNPFLSHAYYARCRQLGLEPDDYPPPAPNELVWFPPLETSEP